MLGWLARGILFLSGIIVGLFLAENDSHFELFQLVVGIALMVVVVAFMALWPRYKGKSDSDA